MDKEVEEYLYARELEEDKLDIDRPEEAIEPVFNLRVQAGAPKLAVVVGHTRISPGAWAVAPISQSEYQFNRSLAENEIAGAAGKRGIALAVFFRDGVGIAGAYRKVNAFRPDVVFELHFNAFSASSTGTETLYGLRNARSKELASAVQSRMVQTFGLRDRGLIERRANGGRGALNVNSADAPSALLEPFFGSNPNDSAIGAQKRTAYAACLIDAFLAFQGVTV